MEARHCQLIQKGKGQIHCQKVQKWLLKWLHSRVPLASQVQQLWMPGEQERGRLQEVARVRGFFLRYPPGTVRNSALAEWVLSLTELGVSNVSSCTEQSRNNYSVLHRYIGDAAEAIQGECMCQSVMYTLYEIRGVGHTSSSI